MFWTLIYPSSGACYYSVELPHWSYCSSFDVCWSFGVVGLEWYPCCRLKQTATRIPLQTLYASLSSPVCATCPAHLILLDFITRTILGEGYRSFSSSLCRLLHSPVTSSLLGPNILLNPIFSNTLSFLSSLNVNDQVSHPYKTKDKIILVRFKIIVYRKSER